MNTLSPHDVADTLFYSFAKIIQNKEAINSINVFPVADQDTGNNIAATVQKVQDVLQLPYSSMKDLAQAVTEASLFAAQGNSGMILTAFLNGFFAGIFPDESLSAHNIARAFEEASKQVQKSIENPAPGTIIDVVFQTSRTITQKSTQTNNLAAIFEDAWRVSTAELFKTTTRLAALQEAQVVDAGALVFVMLIEGFYEKITNHHLKNSERIHIKTLKKRKKIIIKKNKIEVVAIVTELTIDIPVFEQMLTHLGDSLDIIQSNKKVKIHIHTDQPSVVKELLQTVATIQSLQIIDMTTEKIMESV